MVIISVELVVDLQLFAKLPLSFCLVVFVLFSDGGRDDAGEEVFCSAIFGLESACNCIITVFSSFLFQEMIVWERSQLLLG